MEKNGITQQTLDNFTEGDPLQPNEDLIQEKEKTTSCWENLTPLGKTITVEPTMGLFVLACILSMLTTQNLSLEKACRVNLNFTDEVCSSLKLQQVGSENENEKTVQQLLAKYIGARTYITSTVPCIISLFAGAYSDNSGKRRIFLIIPIVGQILLCINNMLNVYFFHQLNLAFLTFSEAVLEGFSGGWSLPFFIMFAYVSSITTEENRTFRMGMLNFALTVGFPIGMGISGILIKKAGYYGGYGTALSIHFINLMYNTFILRDPPRSLEQKKEKSTIQVAAEMAIIVFVDLEGLGYASAIQYHSDDNCLIFSLNSNVLLSYKYIPWLEIEPGTAQKNIWRSQHDNRGIGYFFRMFFSFKNVQESSRVMLRNGPNHRRVRMITYMVVVCMLFGPLYGEISVLYLLTRYRFNWNEVTFSIFQSYNFVTHTVGTIFSITVFSKVLGWHDSMLGIISIVSKMSSSFVYCFAPNAKIFFIAPLVEILNGTSMLAMRSLLSKLVDANELGKVSSLISLWENLMPLLYVPLYTNVYKATMEVLPGAVFLMGAALLVPGLIVFVWLFVEHRKSERRIQANTALNTVKEKDQLMPLN